MPPPEGPITRILRYRELIAADRGHRHVVRVRAVRPLLPRDPRAGRAVPALGIRLAARCRAHRLLVRRRALRRRHLVDLHGDPRFRRGAGLARALPARGAARDQGRVLRAARLRPRAHRAGSVAIAVAAPDSRGLDAAGMAARMAVHRVSVAAARLRAQRHAARGAGDGRRHPPRHVRGRADRERDRRRVPPGSPEVRGDRAHGARLGLRLAAHRARVDEAREQARHRCAPAGRDPAEREMARRESRGDARQVPEPESRGARRAHHRLAGILHSRARARCRRLPRGDPRRIGGARLRRDDRAPQFRHAKRRDPERPLCDERGRRGLVLQAPPRSVRRILSRAGVRAQLDAAAQPAVLRHDAGPGNPGPAQGGRRAARGDDLLRRRLRRRPARSASGLDAPRQRDEQCLVRRFLGAAPAVADGALPRARGGTLAHARDQQRHHRRDRARRQGHGAHPAVRARHPEIHRPAAHGPDALRPQRQLAHPLVLLPAA